MKPEKDRKGGRKLLELREKALCRGEKLANTLRKMVAKGGPGDVPGLSFLKELEQTLESMRQPSDQRDSPKPTPRKRRAAKYLQGCQEASVILLPSPGAEGSNRCPLPRLRE